jgi:hypothetical protein
VERWRAPPCASSTIWLLRHVPIWPRRPRSIGLGPAPVAICTDPTESYLPPDGVARMVHADLPAMLIGGLSALLLQTLHPLAMAGVAEHSNYQADALGRLRRTARFVGTTTFGTVREAEDAIAQVQRVHRRVKGFAADGRPYSADDPDLVTFIHAAETWSFLGVGATLRSPRPDPRAVRSLLRRDGSRGDGAGGRVGAALRRGRGRLLPAATVPPPRRSSGLRGARLAAARRGPASQRARRLRGAALGGHRHPAPVGSLGVGPFRSRPARSPARHRGVIPLTRAVSAGLRWTAAPR